MSFVLTAVLFGGSAVSRRHRPLVSRVVRGAFGCVHGHWTGWEDLGRKENGVSGISSLGFVATSRSPTVGTFWAQDRFLFRAERR